MSEEQPNYKLKFKIEVIYLDEQVEKQEDLDGVRFSETAVSFIKDKIVGTELYSKQVVIPYSAVSRIESNITDIEKVE